MLTSTSLNPPALFPLQDRQRRGHLQSHGARNVRSEGQYRPSQHMIPPIISSDANSRANQGKAKYKAWQKEVDAGTSASAAETRYIELVEKLKTQYGYDANKKPEAVGSS